MLDKEQVIPVILQSLRNGTTIKAACEGANVDPDILRRWRKDDANLDTGVKEAIESRIEIVEDALYKSELDGNVTAQLAFLFNRAPQRWADKRALINNNNLINVKAGVTTADQYLNSLPDKDLDDLCDRLIARKQALAGGETIV